MLHIAGGLAVLCALYLLLSANRAARWLGVAMAVFGVQSGLTSWLLIDPAEWISAARPVLAALIPPLLYVHARSFSVSPPRSFPHWVIHLWAPVLILLDTVLSPWGQSVDALLFVIHGLYAFAIFRLPAPQTRPRLASWKIALSLWLLAMMALDLMVTLEIRDAATLTGSRALVTGSAAVLAALAYILLTGLNRSGPLDWLTDSPARPRTSDPALAAQISEIMKTRQPWKDPDLTLSRLARQLAVPQRTLSATINDTFGQSFSDWINGYRVTEAQRLMQASPGRAIVDLMLDCGFQSRSNFNRAFKAVTGVTPGAWRAGQTESSP